MSPGLTTRAAVGAVCFSIIPQWSPTVPAICLSTPGSVLSGLVQNASCGQKQIGPESTPAHGSSYPISARDSCFRGQRVRDDESCPGGAPKAWHPASFAVRQAADDGLKSIEVTHIEKLLTNIGVEATASTGEPETFDTY